MTADALGSAFTTALTIIDLLETNASYRNLSPYGEPQLGKRGLYQSVPDGTNPELAYLWLLSLSDGDTRPARDRRAFRPAVRDDPRRGRDTGAARASRRGPMSERVAVVTGASRGIGRATALALG